MATVKPGPHKALYEQILKGWPTSDNIGGPGPHKVLLDKLIKGGASPIPGYGAAAGATTTASTGIGGSTLTAKDVQASIDNFMEHDKKHREEMDRLLTRNPGEYTLITPEGHFFNGNLQQLSGHIYQQFLSGKFSPLKTDLSLNQSSPLGGGPLSGVVVNPE